MKLMRKEFFEYVWGILVKHAGANKDDRELFVFAFAEKKEQTMEYRFQGLLGFGGKFWRYDMGPGATGPFYVTCYPEDSNVVRQNIIKKVNAFIAVAWQDEISRFKRVEEENK